MESELRYLRCGDLVEEQVTKMGYSKLLKCICNKFGMAKGGNSLKPKAIIIKSI
jgi:hypothetical protein